MGSIWSSSSTTVNMTELPTLVEAGLRRCVFQLYEHWKIRLGQRLDDRVLPLIRERAAASNAARLRVETECRCGACRIVATSGGPLYTTVCHCSLCRAHNFMAGTNVAMPFAAVRRSGCRLVVTAAAKGACPFVWLQTSKLVRRGRCSLCHTALLFDQERFDPHTLWIVNPHVGVAGERATVPAMEHEYWAGRHDADVCWGSRHIVPPADVFGARADMGSFFSTGGAPTVGVKHRDVDDDDSVDEVPPRGARQFHDLDWNYFPVDPGNV